MFENGLFIRKDLIYIVYTSLSIPLHIPLHIPLSTRVYVCFVWLRKSGFLTFYCRALSVYRTDWEGMDGWMGGWE